ncbi:hypothetical protein [Roseibacillus ishigakijimensis]|uniref:Uncharacterized protein n=1 Tax=Roseibacillus ishigakijimensis TaxID=454146 RepID=A0A934VN46_9BACT|nr:hypothetical protein [Roseibacillus ishigakijimensis]MBK1834932.1 hypothetical protein [Roseibacillus ishigakijimensis]
MTPDQLAPRDWQRIHQASLQVVNGVLWNDEILADKARAELRETLREMEKRYGRVPAILAIRADFSEDPEEAMALHREVLAKTPESLARRLSLQSLLRLLINSDGPEPEIRAHLAELRDLTVAEGEDSDHDELRELQQLVRRCFGA